MTDDDRNRDDETDADADDRPLAPPRAEWRSCRCGATMHPLTYDARGRLVWECPDSTCPIRTYRPYDDVTDYYPADPRRDTDADTDDDSDTDP